MNNQINHHSTSSPPQTTQQTQQNASRVIVVKAIHEYAPVNNDELHIQPNDVITITNAEEGGWWEGTLGGKTGWFPSNYVVPFENVESPTGRDNRGDNCSEEYKSVIVNELIESENAYVSEMEDFYESVVKNIGGMIQCHGDPVIGLLQNTYSGLITAHRKHVLSVLQGLKPGQFRVGKVFMDAASDISAAHTSYCNNHPKFVQLIERNAEKLSGAFGDQSGILRIITSLSSPFRRIEKYGNMLSELERYAEEYSQDRGDLQRGVGYYRNLEKSLTNLRKQKEMELEVLTVGAIKDFEGPDVTSLGDIILMNLLFVGKDKQPRYFVLFSNTILILAYDNVSNTLTYKGRIYVSGITVSCCDGDDVTNGFEISGPTLHPILVHCPTPSIRNTWLTNLNDLVRATRCYSSNNTTFTTTTPPQSQQQPQQHHVTPTQQQQQQQNPVSVRLHDSTHVIGALSPPVQAWNITRLRPSAPYNPFLAEYKRTGSVVARSSSSSGGPFERGSFKFKSGSFSQIGSAVSNEEDLCVLGIVDGFCGYKPSVNPRNHTNVFPNNRNLSNVIGEQQQVKLNVQHQHQQQRDVVKTLPHIVNNLREDVTLLNDKIGQLARQLEEDRNVRGQLIELITRLGGGNVVADLRNGNL